MNSNPCKDQWPEVLSGFEHISRSWDRTHELCSSKILPGEYYVTRSPEIINTVLGSCVSACVRDIDTGIGGMNHFMLPNAKPGQASWELETRYGVAAMESLINDILKLGGRKNRLEIKLFGGGEILNMNTNAVGQRNVEFAIKFMQVEGIEIASQDLGGPHPRKVLYFPHDGRVMIRRLRSIQAQVVCDQETQYESNIGTADKTGEIELFD